MCIKLLIIFLLILYYRTENKRQTPKTETNTGPSKNINPAQNGTTNNGGHKPPTKPNNGGYEPPTKPNNVYSVDQNNQLGVSREKTNFELARKRISSAVSRKANVQKKFTRGFSRAKLQARKDKVTSDPLLLGDLSQNFPPTIKIVRIFTSSTFTGLL